ncbi:MAG: hypothetical protein IPQ09_02145 [Myxococcales bacterium]|nr:hypothetical protein [Myxococcales bacterium]
MNGMGLAVLVAQLPKLCGFSAGGDSVPETAALFVRGWLAGRVKPEAVVIGGACLVLILALRAVAPKLPGVLFAVVGATLAVTWPAGARAGAVPLCRALSELGDLALAGAGIALVSFADTSVLSRTFAARNRLVVRPQSRPGAANLSRASRGSPSAAARRAPPSPSRRARAPSSRGWWGPSRS